MRVEIVIDELVLRGVPAAEAPDVALAVRTRLAELAAEPVAWQPADRAGESVSARPVSAVTPADLGMRVGEAVWRTVTGGAR